MPTADVNGTSLWYEVAGAGPPVVLLHHGIVDSRVWDPQWAAFTPEHQALRYDARGFGRSPMPGGPFSSVDDLLALLDVAGIERAALVGASMGADVELEVALVAPDRVTALVIAPPGMLGRDASAEVKEYGAAEDAALEAGDLDEAVRLNLDFWVAGPGRSLDDVDPEVTRVVAAMQQTSIRAPAAGLRAGAAPDEGAARGAARRPSRRGPGSALVLVGEHDAPDIHEAATVLESELRTRTRRRRRHRPRPEPGAARRVQRARARLSRRGRTGLNWHTRRVEGRLPLWRRSRGADARPARVRRAAGRVGPRGPTRAVRDADPEHRRRPDRGGARRLEVEGGPDEQAIALRDAMRVLFPEAVALVSAARQGFMREQH